MQLQSRAAQVCVRAGVKWSPKLSDRRVMVQATYTVHHNSQDNKGSWRILKDFYCSVTMLTESGLTF